MIKKDDIVRFYEGWNTFFEGRVVECDDNFVSVDFADFIQRYPRDGLTEEWILFKRIFVAQVIGDRLKTF